MLLRRTLRMIMVPALAVALLGAVEGAGGTAQAETTTGRQLLFYNHAYGVFDRETADAVEHSTYLREFANFEVRTTTGAQGEWTGRYLKGRETYVELFGVGDLPAPDDTLGSAGLGLGTERDGDIETVTDRLVAEGVTDPVEFAQTRDFGDGVPVPWFDAILTTVSYDAFAPWAMEFREEYFADPRSNTEPASYPGDVGRERYLPDAYQDHLMRDVTGVRIAVTQGDLDDSVPMLRAGGFVVVTLPNSVIAARGGTTIRFDVTPRDQVGVKRFEFSLNHPVAYRHVEQLGHSTLVVGPGSRAVWTFA
jgi:uncharacterized protein DUF5829